MLKRCRRILCGVLVLCLMLWWLPGPALAQEPTPEATPSSGGIGELARLAPLDSQLFLAFDWRSRFQWDTVLASLDRLKQAQPDLAQRLDETEAMLGISVRDVSKWAVPAGVVAAFPRPGRRSIVVPTLTPGEWPCDVLIALPVADEGAARDVLERLADHFGWTMRTVTLAEGGTALMTGQGAMEAGYTVSHGYVLVGTSQEVLEAALIRWRTAGPSLAQQPFYLDLRQRLATEQGALLYANLQEMLAGLPPIPPSRYVDAETIKPLLALKYVGGSLTAVDGRLQTQVFLKIDKGSDSPFVQALLAEDHNDVGLARFFPVRWGVYGSVDARWLVKLILEAVRLSPGSRAVSLDDVFSRVKQSLGVDIKTDVLPVLQGTLAYSTNAFEILPQVMDFKPGPIHTAAEQRALRCERNLMQIGTALELYAVDHHGRYPTRLAALQPTYLPHIPSCPVAGEDTYSATYRIGADRQSYTFSCGGSHHLDAHLQANQPAYTSARGLTVRVHPHYAMPPSPTSIMALRVTDADKAQELINRVLQHVHVQVVQKGKQGDAVIYGSTNARIATRYAVLSGDSPTLLMANGPLAEQFMEEAIATAQAPGQGAVADLPMFHDLAAAATQGSLASEFLNLDTLTKAWVKTMQANLPRLPKEGRNVSELALKTAATMHPPEGASVTSVEPDGLMYQSRGTPTMLLGAVVVAGAVTYYLMSRPAAEPHRVPRVSRPAAPAPTPANPSSSPSATPTATTP